MTTQTLPCLRPPSAPSLLLSWVKPPLAPWLRAHLLKNRILTLSLFLCFQPLLRSFHSVLEHAQSPSTFKDNILKATPPPHYPVQFSPDL